MKVICTACNKKIDYDKSVKGNSGSSFCNEICKNNYENKQIKLNKSKCMIKEIKCTCNECGHIWHYLESDIKRLQGQAVSNAMIGAGMCCNPFGSLFMNKSMDVSRELEKFSKCPKCNTSNITKEEKFYEKKT